MAERSVTIQDVRDTLKLPDTTDMTILSTITSTRPTDIINHIRDGEYIILGITPEEFMRKHGGDVFDFKGLVDSFKKICRDYESPLTLDTRSMAVDFCSKVIYSVGPMSRSVKQNTNDKTWAFKFPYYDDGVLVVKVAYVCTFKAKDAKYELKQSNNESIVLSIRHASLLAMLTMNRITEICCAQAPPVVMLTPLCGAIFSKLDINKLQERLGLRLADLVKTLNNSCQSGGHYLEYSDLSIASVASIVATKNLAIKNKNEERVQIITKTIKQYLNMHKEYNQNLFMVVAEYATGGIPSSLEPSRLIKLFKDAKEMVTPETGALRAMKMSKRTAFKGTKEDMLRGYKKDDDDDDDSDHGHRGGTSGRQQHHDDMSDDGREDSERDSSSSPVDDSGAGTSSQKYKSAPLTLPLTTEQKIMRDQKTVLWNYE